MGIRRERNSLSAVVMETARRRGRRRAMSSSMPAIGPLVERVMRRGERARPVASVKSPIALARASRFNRGSPMPIITMFEMGECSCIR